MKKKITESEPQEKRVHFIFGNDMNVDEIADSISQLYERNFGPLPLDDEDDPKRPEESATF